jgi:hypothetical protein
MNTSDGTPANIRGEIDVFFLHRAAQFVGEQTLLRRHAFLHSNSSSAFILRRRVRAAFAAWC